MKSITYRNIEVEILDTFECAGKQLAVIEATKDKPFGGGTLWPVKTPFATVPADDLVEVDYQPSLLELALDYSHRRQWYSGEVIHLWGTNSRGAYLREEHGFVNLCIIGYQPSCCIFYLEPDGWRKPVKLEKQYEAWARKAAEVLNFAPQAGAR